MNLETYKKINKIKEDSYKNYVKEKIENLNNNKLNEEDINKIISSIEKDYNDEKNNLIDRTIELFYNHKKYKKFINKDKYISKIKKYIYIIDNIKDFLSIKYNVNNNYSLYYLKHEANDLIDIYKNKKEIYKILKYLILKLSILNQKYSDILKELYREIENYDELRKIRVYESIYRENAQKQDEQITRNISIVSKSLKILKHNVNNKIDNGFFGL